MLVSVFALLVSLRVEKDIVTEFRVDIQASSSGSLRDLNTYI